MITITNQQTTAMKLLVTRLHRCLKQRLVMMSLLLSFGTVQAQITMTALLPPGGLFLRSQLWNVSISKAGGSSAEFQVRLQLKDLQTQQVVLSALSGPFTINNGVSIVRPQSFEPVKYTGTTLSFDPSSNGFLPVGQYQVCYQLLPYAAYKLEVLADDCEQVQVEPLNPPILILPENDSVITTKTPGFNWTPPSPPAMFSGLNYDISVCEIYKNQSPQEAMQNNLPVQQATYLSQPFFVYPLQGVPLEKGKTYAWQIIAKDQQRPAARSEIWSFRTGDKTDTLKETNTVYLLIDDNSHSAGIADSGFVRIKYISYNQTHQVAISVKDETGKVIISGRREIRQGDNYLSVPLDGRFKEAHHYTLVLADKKDKTHTLMFTVR